MKTFTRSEALKTLLGAGAFFLAACKQTANKASDAGPKDDLRPMGPMTAPAAVRSASPLPTGTPPSDSGGGTGTDTCASTQLSAKMDLQQLPSAPEELSVVAKCYGLGQSALFAFTLPKFIFNSSLRGSLEGFYLVHEDGTPIAYKAISPNLDAKSNGLMRIQFLDHMPLNEKSKVAIVFNYNSSYYASPLLGPLYFEHLFRKLPIFGFRQSLSVDQIATLEVVPLVATEELQSLPGATIAANSSTRFNAVTTLTDCVITDLLGNVLSEHGEEFTDFANNPNFIAYKRLTNGYSRIFFRLV